MNLPTLIEKTAFEKLPENLKAFTELRLEPPVSKINDIELKGKCLEIIGLSYAEQGQMGIEPNILAFQRDTLFSELRASNKFRTLTLSEVRSAFKMGIRGESGPFFGMCAKTYHQFLKHYFEKPERVEGMKQYLALIEAPKTSEKPFHIKLQETKESCLKAFLEYRNTRSLPFTAFAYYDFLRNDLKLIDWTKEEKAEIRKQAEIEYEGTLREKKQQRIIKKEQMVEMMLNLTTNATFLNTIKKIALKRYFDNCILKQFDLEGELRNE